jgi:hypothetical protein
MRFETVLSPQNELFLLFNDLIFNLIIFVQRVWVKLPRKKQVYPTIAFSNEAASNVCSFRGNANNQQKGSDQNEQG